MIRLVRFLTLVFEFIGAWFLIFLAWPIVLYMRLAPDPHSTTNGTVGAMIITVVYWTIMYVIVFGG
jgi:hypothetical protein